MKAAICPRYGAPGVIRIEEIEKPVPRNDEILVKVHAASVSAADVMMRKGVPCYGRLFLGLIAPKNKTPGTGFAGVVEAAGSDISRFQLGDYVFGEVLFSSGTNADYICVKEDGLVFHMPSDMSFDEAAPICDGALTSMNFLQNVVRIQPGQKVLVNGASGSLGTAAIQIARHFGAHVTGICSTENMALVTSLGADSVIDYTQTDFTQRNDKYDVIYDTVGKLRFSRSKGSLTSSGIFISPVLSLPLLGNLLKTSVFGRKKALFSATGFKSIPELRVMLKALIGLIEKDAVRTVLDKSFALSDIASAHTYVETGHKTGNIVVNP